MKRLHRRRERWRQSGAAPTTCAPRPLAQEARTRRREGARLGPFPLLDSVNVVAAHVGLVRPLDCGIIPDFDEVLELHLAVLDLRARTLASRPTPRRQDRKIAEFGFAVGVGLESAYEGPRRIPVATSAIRAPQMNVLLKLGGPRILDLV